MLIALCLLSTCTPSVHVIQVLRDVHSDTHYKQVFGPLFVVHVGTCAHPGSRLQQPVGYLDYMFESLPVVCLFAKSRYAPSLVGVNLHINEKQSLIMPL